MSEEVPPPWKHQVRAVDCAANLDEYALFWDMGTGKSRGFLDIVRYKYNLHKRHLRTLILCPPVVVENLRREHIKFTNIKRVYALKGKVSTRLELAKEVFAKEGHMGVTFITNYEALQNEDFMKWMRYTFKPEVVTLDEAHYIKNRTSKRTKKCILLAKKSMYRYILTGTPILNNPLDLFYLYKFLDGGKSFGTSFVAFKAKYFVDANQYIENKPFPDWVFRDEFVKEITGRIESKSMYVKKSECLDLPPLIHVEVPLEMSPPQAKSYKEMKKHFITYIRDHRDNLLKPAVASLAVVKALRLMQIASGFCTTEGGENVVFENNPRTKQLGEDLEQLTPGHKVIIWAVVKENYKAIRKVLESIGLESAYVEVHGGISPKQREKNIDRFNTDETCRVFVGHPKSGGIGINLCVADYTIRYSKDFNLGDYLQSRDRNHRGGSDVHEKITHLEYKAENTLEDHITKVLLKKQKVSMQILEEISDTI